jgi:hypothetical protein
MIIKCCTLYIIQVQLCLAASHRFEPPLEDYKASVGMSLKKNPFTPLLCAPAEEEASHHGTRPLPHAVRE